MIRTPYIFLIAIFLFCFPKCSTAQKSGIGIEIGYGKTTFNSEEKMVFVYPFHEDLTDFLRIGLRYYFNLPAVPFVVKSGLMYDFRSYYSNVKLHYLRIPIGIDLSLGEKNQFILGFGWYLSYLLAYTWDRQFFDYTHKRFQVGWYINTGVGFRLSERFNLSVLFQSNFDLTKMYERTAASPPGAPPITLDYKGFDGFLSLCLKYKLFKN